jgi:hypothetical protein
MNIKNEEEEQEHWILEKDDEKNEMEEEEEDDFGLNCLQISEQKRECTSRENWNQFMRMRRIVKRYMMGKYKGKVEVLEREIYEESKYILENVCLDEDEYNENHCNRCKKNVGNIKRGLYCIVKGRYGIKGKSRLYYRVSNWLLEVLYHQTDVDREDFKKECIQQEEECDDDTMIDS